jgi:hypothetical protein
MMLSSLDYIASDDRMTDISSIAKDLEGSTHGLRYNPGIWLEGLRKNITNFNQGICCPG